jgi:hypothetical protein
LHAAQQGLARRIEHDAASPAFEKLEAKLLFQSANLLAHCAVREVQDLGRRAQVLDLGNGAERGQVLQGQAAHSGKHILPRWKEQVASKAAAGLLALPA